MGEGATARLHSKLPGLLIYALVVNDCLEYGSALVETLALHGLARSKRRYTARLCTHRVFTALPLPLPKPTSHLSAYFGAGHANNFSKLSEHDHHLELHPRAYVILGAHIIKFMVDSDVTVDQQDHASDADHIVDGMTSGAPLVSLRPQSTYTQTLSNQHHRLELIKDKMAAISAAAAHEVLTASSIHCNTTSD